MTRPIQCDPLLRAPAVWLRFLRMYAQRGALATRDDAAKVEMCYDLILSTFAAYDAKIAELEGQALSLKAALDHPRPCTHERCRTDDLPRLEDVDP